jgi:2-keto-4-pentenoate hydratase/2-oxohepta-3-ene-1,7-dioic acid hydratase in catechol pathway
MKTDSTSGTRPGTLRIHEVSTTWSPSPSPRRPRRISTSPAFGREVPVRRIYCIGKNYTAHIIEMNADERDPPVIFMKPSDAIVKNGGEIPYPIFTTTSTTSASLWWR